MPDACLCTPTSAGPNHRAQAQNFNAPLRVDNFKSAVSGQPLIRLRYTIEAPSSEAFPDASAAAAGGTAGHGPVSIRYLFTLLAFRTFLTT